MRLTVGVLALVQGAAPDAAAASLRTGVRPTVPSAPSDPPACPPPARVRAVRVEGTALPDADVRGAIVTAPPTRLARALRVGVRPCVDSAEVDRDALRLAVLHRQRGWFRAAVEARLTRRRDGTDVRFTVTPGARARIASVAVDLGPTPDDDADPASASTLARLLVPLRALAGAPLDRVRVDSTIAATLLALHDAGYARARLGARVVQVDSGRAAAVVAVALAPGARLRIADVAVTRTGARDRRPRYTEGEVRRLADVEPGAFYSAAALERIRHRLQDSDAFRVVALDTLSPDAAAPTGTIGLRVAVTEAETRTARVGVGWGTLDCTRLQARYADRGLLGPGRTLAMTARVSRLGLGRPADVAPATCTPFLRDDPLSARLNYHVDLTLGNPTLFGARLAPRATLYSERRTEPYAFLRETDVGATAALERRLSDRLRADFVAGYETGRTLSTQLVACERFALCGLVDYLVVAAGSATASADAALVVDGTRGARDPRHGARVRLDLRAAHTRFDALRRAEVRPDGWASFRVGADGAAFQPLAGGVLAARLLWSRTYAPGAPRVNGVRSLAPHERQYGGGQNSVRGFRQNMLGPTAYVVRREDTDSIPLGDTYGLVVRPDARLVSAAPEGGLATALATLEWRRRLGGPVDGLQAALFVDAGTVWSAPRLLPPVGDVRITPGAGLRVDTPVGPLRIDVGYNRVQRERGRAFILDSLGVDTGPDARLRVACVSLTPAVPIAQQFATPVCPATFAPRIAQGFLQRLVFHFSLGQAF